MPEPPQDSRDPSEPQDTRSPEYAARLRALEGPAWKRWLDVQAPYRWNLRRLELGRVLEPGCGIGRNLRHLGRDSVGIDHNAEAVAAARERGCRAYLPEEFRASGDAAPGSFDALLLAHVLEHMTRAEAVSLVGEHLAYIRDGGRVVLITPQEAGFRSDPSHVESMDFGDLRQVLEAHGMEPERSYSFPLPRLFGRWFLHNEFVVVARKSAS